MNLSQLKKVVAEKKNFLCVGLDTDINKLPAHLPKNEVGFLEFNRRIVEATSKYCVAYKMNTAFYEAMGKQGWFLLEQTRNLIPSTHFTIADAKRADIGNTSAMYAKAFFEQLDFDALTVAPYMGFDSVSPFLQYKEKTTILLALTSNQGAADFQLLTLDSDELLFEKVLKTASAWAENLMFVVGATQAAYFQKIRQIVPEHFLLVPGVGAQGGDFDAVASCGYVLINSSREVIYAASGEDFASAAAQKAEMIANKMKGF